MEVGQGTSSQLSKPENGKNNGSGTTSEVKSEAKSTSGQKRVRNRPPRSKNNKKGQTGAGDQKTKEQEDGIEQKPSTNAQKKTEKRKKNSQNKKGSKKESKDSKNAGEAETKVKLKVVIRRLPPNLPEEIFWKAVSPWVRQPDLSSQKKNVSPKTGQDQLDSNQPVPKSAIAEQSYYVPGKLKDGSRRGIQADSTASPHTFSRAYIRFKTIEELIEFHRGFDGHLFRDAKGNEYIAVVEFAPYQKMQNDGVRRKKQDTRMMGTIENDDDYKQFVHLLQQAEENASIEKGQGQAEKTDAQLMAHLTSLSDSQDAQKQAKNTPLLEHLRAQKAAKLGASAAMKQARRANPTSSSTKGKSKAAVIDHSIPTGPKAMMKQQKKANVPGGGAKSETEKKKKASKETERSGKKAEEDGSAVSRSNKKTTKKERAGKGEGDKKTTSVSPNSSSLPAKPPKMAILKRGEANEPNSNSGTAINSPSTIANQVGTSESVAVQGGGMTDEVKRNRGRRVRNKGGGGNKAVGAANVANAEN